MQLAQIIENILFASETPLGVSKLCTLTGAPAEDVINALGTLRATFNTERGGLVVVEHEGRYTLASNPQYSGIIAQLRKDDALGELSRPALETLSVIAYRGPATKPEIEQIRGVNCSVSLRNLLLAGLIEESDSSTGERTYAVSMEFLRHLGIDTLPSLPEYERLHSMLLSGAPQEEAPTSLTM